MSMKLSVRGYREGDDVSDPEAGVELGYGPYPIRRGDEQIGVTQHNAEMEHGFDVDLEALRPRFKRLRFLASF